MIRPITVKASARRARSIYQRGMGVGGRDNGKNVQHIQQDIIKSDIIINFDLVSKL